MQKAHWVRGLFQFIVVEHHYMKSAGTQGRNLEARSEAEAMVESSSLACSPWLVKIALHINPRLPAKGWHCPQRADIFTSIINQENASTDILFFQLRLSLINDSSLCHLRKTTTKTTTNN